MKKIFLRNKWLLLMLVVLLLLVAFSATRTNSIDAENGQLDLSRWDFQRDGNIRLDGQWEFYWQQLFTYNDFINNKVPKPYIAQVPKAWTEFKGSNQFFSGQGFATYRLHIKTGLVANELLSLKIDNFSSAYKLLINDKEIASNGKVSTSKEDYRPQYKPVTAVFIVPSSEFDVIIQVANFDFYKGGFWNSVTLGTVQGVQSLHDHSFGKEAFIIGALLLAALYYLTIFIMIRSTRAYLYFAISCILAIPAFDFIQENLLCKIFSNIPFNVVIFSWYNSVQWLPFVFILYVGELFYFKLHCIIIKTFVIISVLLTIISLVTPPAFYSGYGRMADYIMLLEVAYSILLAVSGLKQKKQGAGLYLLTTVVLLMTVFHDFLFLANIINSTFGQISFMGIFLLLFAHTMIHAKISADEYNEKARLLLEIQQSKESAVLNERKFLQAQIKPHFIYNALSIIASVCTRNPSESRRLVVSLGEYLRNSFDFGDGDDMAPLSREIELIEAYVEIEKARFGDRIEFQMNCSCSTDIKIPRLSIQPLVENAIRHGIFKKSHGGRVEVDIHTEKGNLKVNVTDDGLGMTEEYLDKLRTGNNDIKGVGVRNINARLTGMYNKGLQIESKIGAGTICSFEIPLVKSAEGDLSVIGV